MADRFVLGQPADLPYRLRQTVAPRVVCIVVERIDRTTRKHVCSCHECRAFVPPDHEDLRAAAAVAQDQHRRGEARNGHLRAGRHDAQW